MSRTRTALTPALAALSSLALLTACAAGPNAQTIKPYAPSDGVLANSGDIRVLNALVVASETGTGVVSLTIVNRGERDNRLTDLTSPDGTVDLTGNRELLPGKAVRFGAATTPSATISALGRQPGENITLRMTFSRSEPITLQTVVVPATGQYADITPGPETPAETTESPTPEPTDGSTESPTGSPTETPS